MKEPLVKMLCHQSVIKSLAISQDGKYMATSGLDHLLNIWDLRTYKQLKSIKVKAGASSLAFSQKNCVAASLRNEVVIYNNVISNDMPDISNQEEIVEVFNEKDVYLKHRLNNVSIQNLQFCPFEDVLGIGHGRGISSILVPGKNQLI